MTLIEREFITPPSSLAKPKEPIYTHTVEHKIWRVVKDIFSLIIFPVALYRFIHTQISRISLPATTDYDKDETELKKANFEIGEDCKMKRIAVKVDGYIIDAVVIGNKKTLNNGRWVLKSVGNGNCYENYIHDQKFKQILTDLSSNAIVFNYPGVLGSSGRPSRSAMRKAYLAMLNFLEDQEKGIGATEIIGIGHSIGGGVQGDALQSHPLKDRIKYVFVKDRTFSDIATLVKESVDGRLGSIISTLVKFFGWNISSIASSKRLQADEIIVQADYDDVIIKEGSLAYKIQEDKSYPQDKKHYFNVNQEHNGTWDDAKPILDKIKELLKQPCQRNCT